MATNLLRPPPSFRRRPESRRVGREVKRRQVLSDGELGGRACGCHSRCAGMDSLNHWIPACAGMTEREILVFSRRLRASSVVCSRPACRRQAPLYHLGGLFQTPRYHLHSCGRASMQAGRHDERSHGHSPATCPAVIPPRRRLYKSWRGLATRLRSFATGRP